MQIKNAANIIFRDIISGFQNSAIKFLLVVFFFLCSNILFIKNVNILSGSGLTEDCASVSDCWINLIKGIGIYIPSNEIPFQLPFFWLLQQSLLSFLIVSYPTQDLYTYGVQIFTRTKSKSLWWISKCLWIISTVISFYVIAFITSAVPSFCCYGEIFFEPNTLINYELNYISVDSFDSLELYMAMFFLPVITSIALSMVQMTLSFILSPVISYLLTVCYIIASAYYCSPILTGNFLMLLRNKAVEPSGYSNTLSLVIDATVFITAFFVGLVYFLQSDILKKR